MNSIRSLPTFVFYLRIVVFQELQINDLGEINSNAVKMHAFNLPVWLFTKYNSNKIKQSHAFQLCTIYKTLPHHEQMYLLWIVFAYQFTYDCCLMLQSGFHNNILGITIYVVIFFRLCIFEWFCTRCSLFTGLLTKQLVFDTFTNHLIRFVTTLNKFVIFC